MTARERFESSMTEAKDLLGLFRALKEIVVATLDLSDILRASLVFGVGALDSYVHTKLVDELVDRSGKNPPVLTNRALGLNIRLETFLSTVNSGSLEEQVRKLVTEVLSWQTFQRSERIVEALKLLKHGNFWEFAAAQSATSQQDLIAGLDEVVDRRNAIAHEGDRGEISPTDWRRRPINDVYVEKSHQMIVKLVDCMEKYLA